ncbi:uncharacterized protein METZ01_LOCUS364552 [marine metagenome]|uniref:SHOCT domain-containing protein n=1 Tax=marine metagenome TaxID=408172 RepID=A0A382SR92_9ZZZZ
MGWFGSKEVKKIQYSGDNNETNKQICELIGISGSGIYEDEINSFVSSFNEGDVIHFVMEITLLTIDNVVDLDIIGDWDGEDDKWEKILEKATINEGEKYDGSGLVGALDDRLLIVMNDGKDKFDFAYNELNEISSYENSYLLGQCIRIDRKNKNKGEDWTGSIYFEKTKGPSRKSKKMWNGFNEWFPSNLKNLGQRKKREEREQEEKKGKTINISDSIIRRSNLNFEGEENIDDDDNIGKEIVVNRSSIGSGGDDKFSKLKELKEMLTEGLIDKDEFKQMKKEILGK